MIRVSRVLLVGVWLMALACHGAVAGDDEILKVSGNIAKSNQPDKKSYVFSFAELSKLPTTVVHTGTTWTTVSDFTGPRMTEILKAVGARPNAKVIDVKTLDNYPVTIPIADFSRWEVIMAHSQNGKRLTLDTKGPLWIVYPIDKYPSELDNNLTRTKFPWAVKEIVVN